MDDGFTYAGKSTKDFFMRVERFPAQSGAVRKRKIVDVPGRNGALHIQENAYQNYTQSYKVYFHRPGVSSPEQSHAVKSWLLSSGAYQRLEDVYDPAHFRLASFAGPLDVENVLNKYGRCTINFDCDPRSFLKTGEATVSFAEAGTIVNPTAFEALPLITVHGSAAGAVSVGGITAEIKAISEGVPIILDCETQNAYSLSAGAPQNRNGDIYAPVFPVLRPGSSGVAFSGGITSVEIVPRWWEL